MAASGQLGYDKLPPLPWFLAEIAYDVTGTDNSLYVISRPLSSSRSLRCG